MTATDMQAPAGCGLLGVAEDLWGHRVRVAWLSFLSWPIEEGSALRLYKQMQALSLFKQEQSYMRPSSAVQDLRGPPRGRH